MDLKLKEKNVVVSGSTEGIGLGIAISFLKEGSNVCITSSSKIKHKNIKNKLTKEYVDNKILSFNCDFTKKNEIEKLHKNILSKWKKIDILICNVGSGEGTQEAIPSEADWDKSWRINFNSSLFAAQVFKKNLIKNKGSIIFISSIAGIESIGAPVEYSVAKSSLIALTKNMAHKLDGKIRVNAIAPGNILFTGGVWDKKINEDKKIASRVKDKVPLKRFGRPEEVGDLCVFLSSDKSSFINGTVIVIDGGQTVSI